MKATVERVFLFLLLLFELNSSHALKRRLASVHHRNLQWALPNFTIYHRQDDLLREVDSIVKTNPSFMMSETFEAKDGAYAGEVKVVTVEPGGFTSRQADKARILMDFGEHGRELISSELGLLLLRTLGEPGGVLRAFGDDEARGRKLQQLLEGTVMKILPMENEGGRRLVEAGKLCERKNARGVDPNRNWPVDWGQKEKDYDPNEEYPGTAPFSEPEVQVLNRLATEFKPHVWLNIHSGMEAMFVPWDHRSDVPQEAQGALTILQQIHADIMGGTGCVVGSGGKSVGYLAHGTATDYMFKELHVPMSYTWEIYGDFNANFNDCFRMFNPLDEKGLQAVLQRWLKAIMRLVELMPSHPALKESKAWSLPRNAQPDVAATKPAQSQAQGSQQPQQQAAQLQQRGNAPMSDPAVRTAGQTDKTTTVPGTSSVSSVASHVASGADAEAGKQLSSPIESTKGSVEAGSDNSTRVAVVASRLGWGTSLDTRMLGFVALVGLVMVGMVAARYLARGSSRARESGGQGRNQMA